ncbi:MAG: hypothetical protein ABIW76_15535, partial [Fibrobacteria bacterium]
MPRINLGRAPGIGIRWPYKALNYLPPRHLWKYLTLKSGGQRFDAPFQLGKSLSNLRRVLIALPEDFQEILIAFPVVQSLVQALPKTEFMFLVPQDSAGFISSLYGPDRALAVRPMEFHWGEPHFQVLVKTAAGFQADISLNLRSETPPLMQFLLRSASAPIRVQVSGDAPPHFANLSLNASDPPNHLRRVLQVLRLWDATDQPIVPKWSRLTANPENLREAGARLSSKGVTPEKTRLFLWQNLDPVRQRELFRAAVSERASQGAAQPLVVVNGAGPLYASDPPPQDLILATPVLEIDSTGLLLGLFAQTACSIGLNGPLLQLAGIADTDVEAKFTEADAPWDTSFLNP